MSGQKRKYSAAKTLVGVAKDLAYISLTFVPVAAVGVPIVKFFGGNPVDYIDEFAMISAGINVGVRGESTRAFLTSLAVAGVTIFSPEAREAITNGLEAGLNSLGWEDAGKSLFYFGCWAIGKVLRDYYTEKTRRFWKTEEKEEKQEKKEKREEKTEKQEGEEEKK